jgi:hypothetical protein
LLFLRIIHDNKMKNNDNALWAWCQFKTWTFMKYESFLWFEYIMTSCWAPSSKQCHFLHASSITKILFVMNIMVNFKLFLECRFFIRMKTNKMKNNIFSSLWECNSQCEIKSICFRNKWFGRVHMDESELSNKLS